MNKHVGTSRAPREATRIDTAARLHPNYVNIAKAHHLRIDASATPLFVQADCETILERIDPLMRAVTTPSDRRLTVVSRTRHDEAHWPPQSEAHPR